MEEKKNNSILHLIIGIFAGIGIFGAVLFGIGLYNNHQNKLKLETAVDNRPRKI